MMAGLVMMALVKIPGGRKYSVLSEFAESLTALM